MTFDPLPPCGDRTPDRPITPETFRPLARTLLYASRGGRARLLARVRSAPKFPTAAPIFIIGCGRSGTTVLGQIFSAHPAVTYIYEPYDLWAAMDPATDFLQLYSHGPRHCILGADNATERSRRRFYRLMRPAPGRTLAEKSPLNSLRIGYINAIVPDARFVHIVRNGLEVSSSIGKVAAVTKRMAFRPPLNEWWGVGDVKWTALQRDGQAAGYYPDEVTTLTTDAQRGAYEWLVSLREVENWRQSLGSRLIEVRYEDLTSNPRETLTRLMTELGFAAPDDWLQHSAGQVRPPKSTSRPSLMLPEQMCSDFNRLQAAFNFTGAAQLRCTSSGVNASSSSLNASVAHAATRRSPSSPVGRSPAANAISVTRISGLDAAQRFRAEWAQFAEDAGARNPFTHPDILLPWAETFLRPTDQIWLLVARRGSELVGVAPFYRRSWGLGLAHSLQLWGVGRNSANIQLPQLLLHPGSPRASARAVVSFLCTEMDRWDWAAVSLDESLWFEPDWLPRGGTVAVVTKTIRPSVVLPLGQERHPPMKRNIRESLRRARNRLDRSFPGAWTVDRAESRHELAAALHDLTRLHGERSRIAGKERHPDALSDEANWSFLSKAISASADRKAAAIYRLMVSGEAIAALLVLRTRTCTYFLISGMSSKAWEFSPTTLLQAHAIEDAILAGQRWINLSPGPNTAKLRWSESIEASPEFILVPNRLYSTVTFGAYWQTAAAAEFHRERRRHTILQ